MIGQDDFIGTWFCFRFSQHYHLSYLSFSFREFGSIKGSTSWFAPAGDMDSLVAPIAISWLGASMQWSSLWQVQQI
jgi:hypothetical protein